MFFSIWASHSSTEQQLVDDVEAALKISGESVELLHYRKILKDANGLPYPQSWGNFLFVR